MVRNRVIPTDTMGVYPPWVERYLIALQLLAHCLVAVSPDEVWMYEIWHALGLYRSVELFEHYFPIFPIGSLA